MEDKKEIRRIVRQRIKEMTPEARESAAAKIFETIESRNEFQSSHCIALFAAMADEVATAKALHNWLEMGKHIVVPRVEGDVMRFYDYDPEQMTAGAFGIEEPTSDTEIPPRGYRPYDCPCPRLHTRGFAPWTWRRLLR